MMIVRPVRIADLPAIERMAVDSGIGVTSLPNNREKLFEKIQLSLSSFEHEAVAGTGREYYMLVLERDGEVVGTASISAAAGQDEPFYSYRSETIVHASRSLGVNNRIHTLSMCHDLTGMVQLCGFFCAPGEPELAAELISRSRLLFIAAHRERFGRRIIAEMQGLHDDAGHAPFWDAIGRRFFNMDFPAVEQAFSQHSKTFIAELMPAYPVYVPLLPDDAQHAIGQIHPNFERPCRILTDEGFEADNYIDIFDGGAVLTAEIDQLHSVAHSRSLRVESAASLPASACEALIASEGGAFVASMARVAVDGDVAYVNPDTARALGLSSGSRARVVFASEQRRAA